MRELARQDGSALLEDATDAQIDAFIRQNISRPAVTAAWLALFSGICAEFDVLCRRLREAMANGSVLDYEPATDKELRAFRRTSPTRFEHPVVAYAQEVAGRQFFLGRRLLTLAAEVVDESGSEIDAAGRAQAVGAALCAMAALQTGVAREVIYALPADEWAALRESWSRVIAVGQPPS